MESNFLFNIAAILILRLKYFLCGIPPAGEYRSYTVLLLFIAAGSRSHNGK
jgi:hypothetical protein